MMRLRFATIGILLTLWVAPLLGQTPTSEPERYPFVWRGENGLKAVPLMPCPGASDAPLGVWPAPDRFLTTGRTPDAAKKNLLWRRSALELNLTTRKQKPLAELNAALQAHIASRKGASWWGDGYEYSPDGRWLLVFNSGLLTGDDAADHLQQSEVVAISTDGKEMRVEPGQPANFRNILWMPDSRHWVEIVHKEIAFHDIEEPGEVTRVRLVPSQKWHHSLTGVRAKVITPEERYIALDWADEAEEWTTAQILTVNLNRRPAGVRVETIRLPKGVETNSLTWVALSPDGKQIVWQVETSGLTETLWISTVEGKRWKRLGIFDRIDWETPQVRWSPDGQSLLFFDSRILWRLPLPKDSSPSGDSPPPTSENP